ncbi:MAG TPA: undecaprenyldiphospho-muramoylpentapeptide beta-N-acetylglucosaminyltransferase [Clostridiales bacterium]|nr:undecaprenyldiphospho-muramoylpentapeptide beta-N-acetylglucosaminyltransferase [Clostridiales bacterium]
MRILITGGGTAGHINPAIAIANLFKLKDNRHEILFVGTQKGLEKDLVPRAGYDIKFIHAKGFMRKLSLKNLSAVTQFFKGYREASKIIKEFKPDIAIGTGGYVAGAVLYSAHRHRVPVVIHESNAFAGVTNRFISRFAKLAYVNFENTINTFDKAGKVIVSGNPLKEGLLNANRDEARKELNLKPQEIYIVAMGGSRGSETMNQCIVDMLNSNPVKGKFKMIFATGEADYPKRSSLVNSNPDLSGVVSTVPYIYNVETHYAAADLVICRAGAMTCSEMCAMGKASIMIPSPYVTENHQEHNARAIEEHEACFVITEKQLTFQSLYEKVSYLIENPDRIKKMSMNAKKLGKPDAGEIIYQSIYKYIFNKKVL